MLVKQEQQNVQTDESHLCVAESSNNPVCPGSHFHPLYDLTGCKNSDRNMMMCSKHAACHG